jgi:hypothetical protein
MLQILDITIMLAFYTIIAVAAVLVLRAFFWIIDTINPLPLLATRQTLPQHVRRTTQAQAALVVASRVSTPQASRLAWPSAR